MITRAEGDRRRTAQWRRPWFAPAALAALLSALVVAFSSSSAQSPAAFVGPDGSVYYPAREFDLPYSLPRAEEGRITHVRLYVSENSGVSWQKYGEAAPVADPQKRKINFRATRDGTFWFTTQTVTNDGVVYPLQVDSNSPNGVRKITIDTRPPVVALQALSALPGQVAVGWTVQDDNLNALRANRNGSFVLEYRPSGSNALWVPLRGVEPRTSGQESWSPGLNGPVEVRLRVLDDAGNPGFYTIVANGPGGGASALPSDDTQIKRSMAPVPASAKDRRFVSFNRINLNYNVQDVGRSGAVVELWLTRDGNSWELVKSEKIEPGKATNDARPAAFPLKLESEGLYGFTVVSRSGVGYGDAAPKPGDTPHIWIEADWTRPLVRLTSAEVKSEDRASKLVIAYTVDDRNFDETSTVNFSYAERLDDPPDKWVKFAANKPYNNGHFEWPIAEDVPYEIFVRIEATDKAGNTGKAETLERVKVDLKRPKASVVGIEPVKGGP